MVHFLRRLNAATAADADARAPAIIAGSWLAMAIASLVLPWLLYLTIPIDTLANAVAPSVLWSAIWPVLIGVVLAFGLDRFTARLPRMPAGDVGVVVYPLAEASATAGGLVEQVDTFTRRWSVSSVALSLVSQLFAWALIGS
jgi:hypothetical protein